jgi:N-acyl-D-aspartate/D-glutamate deacylase
MARVLSFCKRIGLITAVALGLVVVFLPAQAPPYDVLIRGARIVDGTGNPWFSGEIAIKDGKIAAVGHLGVVAASRVIDGTGLVAAPGFIDLHTHSDLPLLADGNAESKVRDGVTLDVIGESSSVAPRDGLGAEDGEGVKQDWSTFTEYFERLGRKGISMNLISHVSAEQVRRVVMGYDDKPATPEQLEQMKKLVARSMEEGAWGLVTRYESGGPDHPEEIIAMAKVASAYGGNYTSHIGSEGFEQTKEIAFATRVADEANIPVHLFHLKIRGKDNWGTIQRYLDQINSARSRGLDVTANQYPYTAMNHGWSAFFPVWAREGGPKKFAERLQDPAVREKIKKDRDFITWANEHGWWEGITLARAAIPEHKKYEGMRVAEIAKLRGDKDPADTCINLMAEEGGRIGGIFHTMSEEDVRLVMKQPWVSIASDGSAINLEAAGFPHPRSYSTNARVLGYYVRDQHVLTLEDAIRKMTSLPAQILGLTDRGQIHPGFAADVVLFDPAKVRETNSYEKPKSYPEGIPYVLVNGGVVIDKGQHTGARPGKVIYGKGYKAAHLTGSADH